MTDGLIILNKPGSMGSYDTIRALKKKVPDLPKAGFLGTLDPMATGVLPVFFGNSTKLIPFMKNSPKIYRMKISFGTSTDSYDVTGKVTEKKSVSEKEVNASAVLKIIPEFIGKILQSPPPLSACKINGKRAYDLFFSGKPAEIAPREKEIYEIDLISFTAGSEPETELVVSCESGTYMRSLAVDIGKKLGVPAHLCYICRLACGDFLISDSVSLETVLTEGILKHLRPADNFLGFSEVVISENSRFFDMVKNGNQLSNIWQIETGKVQIRDSQGKLLAIYDSTGADLCAVKVLI